MVYKILQTILLGFSKGVYQPVLWEVWYGGATV
jgi:hypothetical protein